LFVARLQENSFSYHHETFRLDHKCLCDNAVKLSFGPKMPEVLVKPPIDCQ